MQNYNSPTAQYSRARYFTKSGQRHIIEFQSKTSFTKGLREKPKEYKQSFKFLIFCCRPVNVNFILKIFLNIRAVSFEAELSIWNFSEQQYFYKIFTLLNCVERSRSRQMFIFVASKTENSNWISTYMPDFKQIKNVIAHLIHKAL